MKHHEIRWSRPPRGGCYVVALEDGGPPSRLEDAAYRYAGYARLCRCAHIEVRGQTARARFALEVTEDGAIRCVPERTAGARR